MGVEAVFDSRGGLLLKTAKGSLLPLKAFVESRIGLFIYAEGFY